MFMVEDKKDFRKVREMEKTCSIIKQCDATVKEWFYKKDLTTSCS
ncbi:hypothetical protein M153_1290006361 [Pseudoloma neurophilia]|uniref:Uncharacterized protein n=1 Tax=Pseudoloma neurophilia TaxID=146866 RepID=A0A0R0M6X3_9MICR|nr:hypothetical protein M153_1290006361 [Pseudoloma neurophilia]